MVAFPTPGRAEYDGSRLRSASPTTSQLQFAVKLHVDFLSRWEIVDCAATLSGFTGFQAGTAGLSLLHSCTSDCKRNSPRIILG